MLNLDKKIVAVVVSTFVLSLILPYSASAYTVDFKNIRRENSVLALANIQDFVVRRVSAAETVVNKTNIAGELPVAGERAAQRIRYVAMTAYSSTPDQTDDSPFITANGTRVRDGIVATNGLPFGTKIKIPELYGDKVFVVTDRMNKRYTDRVDIWMETREEAIQFGVKRSVKIEVF